MSYLFQQQRAESTIVSTSSISTGTGDNDVKVETVKTAVSKTAYISNAGSSTAPRHLSTDKIKVAGVDKPLSPAAAAAHYRRQIKNGVQRSPSLVGVSKDAPDSAALLATQTDLSPHLWTHKTSATAGLAATKAQTFNSSPVIWKPDADANAASAASHARSRTMTVESYGHYDKDDVHAQGKQAAVHIAAVSGRDYAAQAIPDAYEWSDKQRTYTLNSQSMLGLHNRLTEQERLRSISNQSSASSAVDRSKSLGSNIANIESKARDNAKARLSQVHITPYTVNGFSFESPGAAAAYFSGDAAARDDPALIKATTPHYLDHDQKEALFASARVRAQKDLDRIDEDLFWKDPFNNPKFHKEALKVAQKNSEKRLENHGKINVGGGLFMTQSEVEAIAQRNVAPVLDKISEKALQLREQDEERKAKEAAELEKKKQAEEELRKKKAEEKKVLDEQKAEDRRISAEEKAKKKLEKEKIKATEKAEQDKKKAELNKIKAAEKAEQDKKKAELNKIKAAEKAEKEKQRVLEKSEKDKVKAEQKAKRDQEKAERLEAEQKVRHEKYLLEQQQKAEKVKLDAALSTAKQAQALAAAESSRLLALKEKAAAEVEAARLAEERAKDEEAKAAAQAELEAKELALAEAAKEYQAAQESALAADNTVASAAQSVRNVEMELTKDEDPDDPANAENDADVDDAARPSEETVSSKSHQEDESVTSNVTDEQPWEIVEKPKDLDESTVVPSEVEADATEAPEAPEAPEATETADPVSAVPVPTVPEATEAADTAKTEQVAPTEPKAATKKTVVPAAAKSSSKPNSPTSPTKKLSGWMKKAINKANSPIAPISSSRIRIGGGSAIAERKAKEAKEAKEAKSVSDKGKQKVAVTAPETETETKKEAAEEPIPKSIQDAFTKFDSDHDAAGPSGSVSVNEPVNEASEKVEAESKDTEETAVKPEAEGAAAADDVKEAVEPTETTVIPDASELAEAAAPAETTEATEATEATESAETDAEKTEGESEEDKTKTGIFTEAIA